jgi:HPr kinase/phosphorylase
VTSRAHGALVEVEGLGVMLVGPSGIGKSECALELVRRGHRLVADDVVLLEPEGDRLFGEAPEIIRHHMELRGIGIVYLPDLFGPDAVRDRVEIGLACRLAEWRPDLDVERVGLERPTEAWAGVALPVLLLPARPAGSLATLVEVAVRDHLLRREGRSAPHRLDDRLRAVGRDPARAKGGGEGS